MKQDAVLKAPVFSYLTNSFRLINCFWIPVIAVSLFSNVSITGSLGIKGSLGFLFFDRMVSVGLEVVFWSVMFGLIVDIHCGFTKVLTWDGFKENFKRGWWIAAAFVFAPWMLHFSAFLISGGREVLPFLLFKAVAGVFMAYWSAEWFVRLKSCRDCAEKRKSIDLKFTGKLFFIIIIFFLFSFGVVFLSGALSKNSFLADVPWIFWRMAILACFSMFALSFLVVLGKKEPSFKNAKTLILINAPYSGFFIATLLPAVSFYPSFFMILKALTPKEYRVFEFNRDIWNDRYYQENGLVAISTYTNNCSEAYKIAKEFRRRGAKVVMGGPHVSFFPDEALMFCDAVVVGPAEGVWEEVVRDYEGGALRPVYQGSCSEADVRRVHDFLMTQPDGKAAAFVLANRGCKFHCYFCAIPGFSGNFHLAKPVDQVVELVKKAGAGGKRMVNFLDNNIYVDPVYTKELLRALVPLKIKWVGCASIDIAKDDEALGLLKESGCQNLLIGYEVAAGSTEVRRGGKLVMAQDYLVLTKKIKKAGVKIKAGFVFGFPGDSWRGLFHLWSFCRTLFPNQVGVSFLIPFPGARFFKDIVVQERLINLNWRKFSVFGPVFDHPVMGKTLALRVLMPIIFVMIFITSSFMGRALAMLFMLCLGAWLFVVFGKGHL